MNVTSERVESCGGVRVSSEGAQEVNVPEATSSNARAVTEWKGGWPLVLASFLGFSFFSLMSASLGVFMRPIGNEFGWSRTLLSSGIAIGSATTALLSPFVGVLIDRLGSRRVALPGLVATTVAIASFSLVTGSPTQWLFLWAAYALISITVKTTVWTAAVARSFTASQGLALGFVLSGTAAAQAVVPPLANWLIEVVGWRLAYVWLGCSWGGVTLLACWLFLRDGPRSRPDTLQSTGMERAELPGLSIREAWKNTALLRIAIATLIMMLVTIGLLIHQIPIMTAAGVSPSDAAWLASLSGAAGIVGKLVTGLLLDRYRANWVGGLTLGATTFAFLFLIGDRSSSLIPFAMVIAGYSAGTKLQVCSYLTARYAGMKNFGAIYGIMTSLVAVGSGVGPMIAGLVYDVAGNYDLFLQGGAAACILSSILIATLPRYPVWKSRSA